MAQDTAAHPHDLEELHAVRLQAVERRLWAENGFDASTRVLRAILARLTGGPADTAQDDTAAVSAGRPRRVVVAA